MRGRRIGILRGSVHPWLLAVLITATALLGGSARIDITSLLLLRPLVVLVLGAMLLISMPADRDAVRVPAIILGCLAATMAVQLVPLPLYLWLRLPGHDQFAASVALAGDAGAWRPISLYPDLTLNALVALLPAVAMIVGYARITSAQRLRLVSWLVAAAAASALLGLAQILGGGDSPAYFYRFTSRGLPVGLFGNRNHQAVFLALALAPLAVWGLRDSGMIARPIRAALALGGLLLFLPIIILTGSRSGLITAFAVLLLLPWVLRVNLRRRLGRARPQLVTYAAFALAILVLAVIGYMVSSDQAMSINRLLDTNELRAEKRILAAPVLAQMLRDFFPFGLGHGVFEPVFRVYEPDRILTPTYFNRAHNDFFELAMSGGLLTIFVMLVFAGWFVHRTVGVIRESGRAASVIWARMAIVIILGLGLASVTDYPVRTPFLTVVLTLACLWLEDGWQRRGEPST